MKWLKISALLILTLLAMRALSWLLAWLLSRTSKLRPKSVALLANIGAFTLFALLLWWGLSPGEPMDTDALLFGLAVFAVCYAIDVFWSPWRPRAKPLRGEHH